MGGEGVGEGVRGIEYMTGLRRVWRPVWAAVMGRYPEVVVGGNM